MADFGDSDVIRGSERRDNDDQATRKLLRREYARLVETTEEHSAKLDSMEEMLLEVKNTLSQFANQLGKRQLEAESRQLAPSIEIPEFDASNVSDWLSKVEQSFRVCRFSDLDKLDLVAFSLEGYVLQWFSWEMSRREFHSWDEFRRRLLLRFGTAPAESPGNRLSATKRTGTVSAHVTELEELSVHIIEQQTVSKEESITLLQVPVSKLEHSLQIHNESPIVCEHYQKLGEANSASVMDSGVSFGKEITCQAIGYIHTIESFSAKESIEKDESHEAKMVKVESETAMFQSLAGISSAYQVFDKTSPHKERLKSKTKRKLSLSPKTWMFKFKNKNLQRQYSCSRAKCGYQWKEHNSRYGRRMRQTHMSRLLCNLQVRQDLKDWGQLILDALKSHMWPKWKSKLLLHSGFDGNKLPQSHTLKVDKIELQLDQSDITLVGLKVEIASLLEVNCVLAECLKHKVTGSLERVKASLVAKGYSQREGVDFIDTFAPVAKLKPGYASRKGDLPENAVLHLKKSIYSLKQVSHQWFLKFSTTLMTLGFTKSFAVHAGAVDQLKDDLKNSFKLRDLGPLNDFLGLEIARSSAGISVCQPKYAQELLDEASFWVLGNSNAEQMFHRQQNSSSIWHRWRRKPLFLLHFWKNSWLLSEDLVCVYHSFKLEDKLVFRGESIDTIGDVAADEVEVKTLEQKEVLPLTLRDSNKREKQSSLLFLCEL